MELRVVETDYVIYDDDPFCFWCDREGLPSPHEHESDDHP